MRLTPLGKLLIFLIGLGLVATAVYRFLPPEKRSLSAWLGNGGQDQDPPAEPAAEDERDGADGDATADGDAPAAEPEAETSANDELWTAVPGGLFRSGDGQTEVDVPAFLIQRYEVTNGRYARFLEECPVGASCGPRDLPSYWDDDDYLETHGDHPVVFVSWGDASAYCRWANGRLPTAVQWEKAARGTDGRSFPWGETLDPAQVNILGSDPGRRAQKNRADKQIPTWPVSEARYARDASPYDVLGMAGNVSEWTATASPDEPDLRLVAGGSWDSWDYNDGRT